MKNLLLPLLLLCVIPTYAQIKLPIEVLGAEGTVTARTFDLSTEDAKVTAKIWLQVNNLGYENKASVKINDQDWLDLNHETVDLQGQEKARGGMVHGGFNTIRFTIPADGITSGSNTIEFRFNTSDAISNGYRVVRLNVLDQAGNQLLSAERFEEDDPELWTGPYSDANSIAEGKYLWYNAPLISNYLPEGRKGFWYDHEISSGQAINATCSSCHTQDGRDLELFSYSNDAIIERAKFHMLSEEEGKKIASYIRSLSAEYDNVNRYGRPWNPPYQPGPSLDTTSIDHWAAGAGLDAVLDQDKDMLPYLFPEGVNQPAVYNRFDSDKSFDRTLIPLAIQFPDWKHWLPMVHPMDAYNQNNYFLDPNTGPNNPHKNYTEVRNYLESNAANGFPNKAELADKIHRLHNHFRFFVEQGATDRNHWRSSDGDATKNLNDGVARELAATSLARLFAVKNFEFVQEFNLQDIPEQFGDPSDKFQPRQWPGNEYNVFEVPPHFQACVDNNCNQFMGQPTETGMYESTNWYQLQMVINGGDGNMSHNSPVDYNYHPDFITKACNSSGIDEPLRYYHSMNVMYQTKTWSGGDSPNSGVGFRIRVMGPWNIYGITDGNQFNGYAPGEFARTLEDVQPGMTAWTMNAMLRQFLTEVQKDHNRLAIWNRTEDGDDNSLDRADKTFADIQDALERTERQETFFWHYAAKCYYYIPKFQELGVDCQIIEELIDWCQAAWPLIDWHVFSDQGQLQLDLALEDDDFCTPTNAVIATATNVASEVLYHWTVNGQAQANTSFTLPIDALEAGDVITCQVSSESNCIASNSVESSLTLPSKGYSFGMRKIGAPAFGPMENTVACTGDQFEIQLNLDLQPLQWLDAKDVSTGTEPEDNAPVDTWYDKSGNGFHATANLQDLQPTYRTDGMNGMPAVYFAPNNNADGLELFSTDEDDFLEGDWTIVVVGQTVTNGNTDWRDLLGNKTEGNNGWFYRFGGSDARVQVGIGPTLQHGLGYDFSRSFMAQISKEGDVITSYLNGQTDRVITKEPGVSMTIDQALYIGQSSNGNPNTNRYHQGPIAELMVFDRTITRSERQRLEGYLTNKWGLNDELTFTHPYADHSPFEFSWQLPSGDQLTIAPTTVNTMVDLTELERFGDYTMIKRSCDLPVATVSFSTGSGQLQNMIQYHVNGESKGIAEQAVVYSGNMIQLSPGATLNGDYFWTTPNQVQMPQNMNPEFTAEAGLNSGTWTLTVLSTECQPTNQELTFDLTIESAQSTLVHIVKNDTPNYGIDGGNGAADFQPVKLWDNDSDNINQQWLELDQGNGYYAYQKWGSNHCIDAGDGGANGQLLTLSPCDELDQNQQWKKVEINTNIYRLEKRNAPEFSIDGGAGSTNDQQLKLWSSDDTNVNQHWLFEPIDDLVTAIESSRPTLVAVYPNPVRNVLFIDGVDCSTDKIQVFNVLGAQQQLPVHLNESLNSMDVSELKPGQYIVQIISLQTLQITRFTKIK